MLGIPVVLFDSQLPSGNPPQNNMADLVLRCQYKGGKRSVVQGLKADSTLEMLQEKIWLLTDVPPHAQKILTGFPPKELCCTIKSSSLSSLGIRSGDTLIIEQDKTASRIINSDQVGSLGYQDIPLSRNYVMTGDMSLAPDLRQLIVKCVSSDPVTYNDVFLGQSNNDYCRWIQNADNWGGAIELSILSKHYGIEIAVVDTETERIDRFGEDEKYLNRVFLIYDGIHYDPLGVQENSSGLPLQTVFPCEDERKLLEALSLAADAKKNRKFTNISKFTLRCLACNTQLTGQAQAQEHAMATGHTNFGEV